MAKSITGNAQETNKGGAVHAAMSDAEIEKLKANFANPTVEGFEFTEEERIGFAPYWNPEPGAFFMAIPVAKDERDPDFVRVLFRALHDMLCFRGPAEAMEPVIVKKGEEFSIGVFYSLMDTLDLYIDNCDFEVPVKLTALEKVKTSTPGREVWRWNLKTTPQAKKLLDVQRTKIRASIGGKTAANALPASA